jgi:hypothetical protein
MGIWFRSCIFWGGGNLVSFLIFLVVPGDGSGGEMEREIGCGRSWGDGVGMGLRRRFGSVKSGSLKL